MPDTIKRFLSGCRASPLVDMPVTQIASPVEGVDVWLALTEPGRRKLADLASILSPEERVDGSETIARSGYQRYVAVRDLLRCVLSTYLDVDPDDIEFRYGRAGKPALATPLNHGDLRFNLSHSGNLALVAVTSGRGVGVDIEQQEKEREFVALAGRSLSDHERSVWEALPPDERREMFYRVWVRKESLLKGLGDGLTMSLRRIDVSETLHDEGRVTSRPLVDGASAPWTIFDLDLPGMAGDVAAALALEDLDVDRGSHISNVHRLEGSEQRSCP
jgi:4'-phosphopantetheinyl transferase